MRRIIIAVTNDLATDQRVDRTCRALTDIGWQVTLVGRRLPDSPRLAPRPYATRRMHLLFRRSAFFYAEYNLRLFLYLLFRPADHFFANDTDTLPACTLAAVLRRKPLAFDAHELFPDVPELADRPRIQAVWKWIERTCLPHVKQAFTVSQSVAEEYRHRYGIEMSVVRNTSSLPSLQFHSRTTLHQPRILLYQGAVNIGRGIHEMIDAMEFLPECKLLIIGTGDILEQERRYAAAQPWSTRVEFLGRMDPESLHAITPQADLGLCLLQDLGLNYRYSLPNRISDFANAGVPVLATDFPEIRRTLLHYGTGTLTEPLPGSVDDESYRHYISRLVADIKSALRYWDTLPIEECRQRFQRASEELSWSHEKNILLSSFTQPNPQPNNQPQ